MNTGLTALVVDDEYHIRHGILQTVAWEEYGIAQADTAIDGAEALAMLRSASYDIVITDVRMPRMDGLSLLREMRAEGMRSKVIAISGYDEFDYVKQALRYGVENYILKPIDDDELSETLFSAVTSIAVERAGGTSAENNERATKESVLRRLIAGTMASKDAAERLSLIGVRQPLERFSTAIVRSRSSSASTDMASALLDRVRDWSPGIPVLHAFSDIAGDVVVVLCPGPNTTEEEVEATLRELVRTLRESAGIETFVTVGEVVEGFDRLADSFRTAKELQDFDYVCQSGTVLSTRQQAQRDRTADTGVDLSRLRDALVQNHPEEVRSFYNDISRRFRHDTVFSLESSRSLLIELSALLINVARSMGVKEDIHALRGPDLYDRLFGRDQLDEAMDWLERISLQVVDAARARRTLPMTLAERAVEYVDTHFDQEISLKTMSAELNVNPSYLGQVFKQTTGILFTNYLNGLRIARAQSLLDESSLKASEIANRCGYGDPDYFYKVFHKYCGVYPLEYRNRDRG